MLLLSEGQRQWHPVVDGGGGNRGGDALGGDNGGERNGGHCLVGARVVLVGVAVVELSAALVRRVITRLVENEHLIV